MTPGERRLLAEQLVRLARDPAWTYIVDHIDQAEQREIDRVARGGLDAEQYGRSSGVLHTLRGLSRLPTTLAETLAPPPED